MAESLIAPYGSWKSPITSDLIVSSSIRIGGGIVDGEDIYWLEGRPSEGGRYVLVHRAPDGTHNDLTPPPLNVRTRVHEYGGGSVIIDKGRIVVANYSDQRLYTRTLEGDWHPITPEASLRYADGIIDHARSRIICVREDHTEAVITAHGEPINTLVSVSLDGRDPQQILAEGYDFYASPRLSPDGRRLAWLSWNHPNMPWDGTELWVADIGEDGTLDNPQRIAGGKRESIFQPEWSPDGVLTFVSDRNGWWNLYRWTGTEAVCLYPMAAEFGQPQWIFGLSTYTYRTSDEIVCTYSQEGLDHLARLNVNTGAFDPIVTPYTTIGSVTAKDDWVLFRGGAPTRPGALIRIDVTTGDHEVLQRSVSLDVEPGYLSVAEPIEFPTEGERTAYGLFYAPRNDDIQAPPDEKPPLLVISHGGPTGMSSSALSLRTQYWTSRGFAVLDVNYGGSAGYGRAYRDRLTAQWGIVDVQDCINGARYLVDQQRVDGNRLAIRGGSAGGYTTLSALTFRDFFHAGASYYGVSDLEALALDTHKFESRYLDGLVGPYPETKEIYETRSPIHHAEKLNCPVIFFQGLEDEVVPPRQAETMVEALDEKGIPVAYLPFEGEQHGFRRAENIKRALDAELYFYSRIFGFKLAEEVEPVEIKNLP
jgi:dipeptidyl aminopeptidase/acylaminoacyl peptidase